MRIYNVCEKVERVRYIISNYIDSRIFAHGVLSMIRAGLSLTWVSWVQWIGGLRRSKYSGEVPSLLRRSKCW